LEQQGIKFDFLGLFCFKTTF